jgi:threonine synthase
MVYDEKKYIMDPHGAVAYLGLKKFLKDNNVTATGIFAETAHPAKFKEVVDETLATEILIPAELQKFLKDPKKSITMTNSYDALKSFLTKTF